MLDQYQTDEVHRPTAAHIWNITLINRLKKHRFSANYPAFKVDGPISQVICAKAITAPVQHVKTLMSYRARTYNA
jgi:hypothetical protein